MYCSSLAVVRESDWRKIAALCLDGGLAHSGVIGCVCAMNAFRSTTTRSYKLSYMLIVYWLRRGVSSTSLIKIVLSTSFSK